VTNCRPTQIHLAEWASVWRIPITQFDVNRTYFS